MRRFWSAPLAFAAALSVYWSTLCPTVYVEGSGELIGAAYLLGTPHPTGYPFFCLLARLFTVGIPWGSIAFRVNVASAFTGALAVGALAAFLQERGLSPWGAMGAALALGFSRTFWSQMVIAEVYGLSMLMTVLVMAVGLRAAERQDPRLLGLTGFLMGLGLTAHLSQMLLWPGLMWALLRGWPGIWRRGRVLAGGALGLAGGYSLVLYLPLRNGRGAGFHWADLGTPGLLWDHLTGALYHSSFFALPWQGMALNAGRWFTQMAGEFQPLLVPLFGWGIWRVWKQDRPVLVATGGMILMVMAAVLNYHRDPNGIGVFFLPSFVGLAIFLGYALDHLGPRLGRTGPLLLGVIAPLAVLAGNWHTADHSHNRIAYQYGCDILDHLPQGAVLLSEADDASFLLDYLVRVEGMRPDVALFNRAGQGTDLLVGPQRRLPRRRQFSLRRQREAALIEQGERPVFFLNARGMPAEGYQFLPAGLVYRAAPLGEQPQPWPIDLRNAQVEDGYRDSWVRKLQANYWFMLGEQELALGRRQEAIQAYEQAAALAFDSRTMRFNVALMLYRCGELQKALEQVRTARDLDPWQPAPYRLKAHILRRLGRLDEGVILLKRAAELEGSP